MSNYCAFTICSKNYLAQAITLKKSFVKHNPNLDFYIFLADTYDAELLKDYDGIISLNKSYVPAWEDMAFKYDVIEFNTSIKPFCIKKLFESYEKIIYLDPDTYVVSPLNFIYDLLETKDFVITPHYNHIENKFSGAVSEEELLFVGIYNLGFCAIKRSLVGEQIVSWWMNRLQEKCYADKNDALHVDQKWIDFLPAFFPNNIYICHHPGINMAIWNLHERILITDNAPFKVRDLVTKEEFPLLFFHFSGFDPFNKKVLNRRHPQFNISDYPVYKNIIEQYSSEVYENGYELFSKQCYGFNQFENGIRILPLNRRLYAKSANLQSYDNLFSTEGKLYQYFKQHKMLSNCKNSNIAIQKVSVEQKNNDYKKLNKIMKLLFKVFNCDRYNAFLRALNRISLLNYQVEIFK